MKKLIFSSLVVIFLNSCVLISLVDGVASTILNIFVYNEKTEQTYKISKKQDELDIKIDFDKVYTDEKGRQVISYKDLPQEYHQYLFVVN